MRDFLRRRRSGRGRPARGGTVHRGRTVRRGTTGGSMELAIGALALVLLLLVILRLLGIL